MNYLFVIIILFAVKQIEWVLRFVACVTDRFGVVVQICWMSITQIPCTIQWVAIQFIQFSMILFLYSCGLNVILGIVGGNIRFMRITCTNLPRLSFSWIWTWQRWRGGSVVGIWVEEWRHGWGSGSFGKVPAGGQEWFVLFTGPISCITSGSIIEFNGIVIVALYTWPITFWIETTCRRLLEVVGTEAHGAKVGRIWVSMSQIVIVVANWWRMICSHYQSRSSLNIFYII